jgi:hypothetical protein
MAKSKIKDLMKVQAGQAIQRIAERRVVEYLERRAADSISFLSKPIFVFAAIVPAKKKVQQVLPAPNLKMKETTASPLNTLVANLAYTYGSRPKFFFFMDNAWAKLKDNASYPDLPVSKDDWDTEKDLYDKAKSKRLTETSDQHYSNLIYMSKQNGVAVANGCGNELTVFISSGYIANKTTKTASKKMGKVVIKKCRDTKRSGEAMITLEEMPGAQFYQGCWCLADDPHQKMTMCKGSKGKKMLFKDLPLKEDVLLFAWAVGPLDEGNLSNGFPWQPR